MTNKAKKMMSFLLNAEKLARMNNKIGRFLNRNINHCQIETYLPKSTRLKHNGHGVMIGKYVKIGENVIVYHNVTIGQKSLRKIEGDIEVDKNNYPIIEDNVVIGCGSIILGKIRIGKNSIIGAGSIVNQDVPKGSMTRTYKNRIVKSPFFKKMD